MAAQSKIEWCDHTFNPWEGCQKVAPECDNCYAEARDKRFTGGAHWGPKAPRRRTSTQNWRKPIRWNAQAAAFEAAHGRRQRVFCASLADVFDNAVDPAWRADLWSLIRECDRIDWLILTKRPQNMGRMLPDDWGDGWGEGWPHVWLGTSAGTQKTADQNIPLLLNTPAARRFLSAEPLLGPLWIRGYLSEISRCDGDDGNRLDWVICGGESGPNARPMHPDWARSLLDQCSSAGVPFFFKQWGEFSDHTNIHANCKTCEASNDLVILPNGGVIGGGAKGFGGMVDELWIERGAAWMCRTGKKEAGRRLDGREWNETP